MAALKAVVLARGVGRRLREADAGAVLSAAQERAAAAGQKGMMPVDARGHRPFLDYVLSHLADAGCTEVALVVAPDHSAIAAHYAAAPPQRLRLSYCVQDAPLGTASAVLAAGRFAGEDQFLVVNSDNLYPVHVLRTLVQLGCPGLPGFDAAALARESGFDAERVGQFALIDSDGDGWLRGIREKPGAAEIIHSPGAIVSMNVWRFSHAIFDACRDVPPSERGEFELPAAVALSLERGVRYRVIPAAGAVLDLSRRADVIRVSRALTGVEARP